MRDELMLAPPFDRLWAGQDAFAAVDRLEGEVFRELDGRRTFRTEVAGRGYFVKIHRGVGWGEIVKNLVSGRLPILGAANEWHATRRLAELGVDSLRAVAFGERGGNPARRHSFIITEELTPIISLENYTRSWPQHPPAPALKRATLATRTPVPPCTGITVSSMWIGSAITGLPRTSAAVSGCPWNTAPGCAHALVR